MSMPLVLDTKNNSDHLKRSLFNEELLEIDKKLDGSSPERIELLDAPEEFYLHRSSSNPLLYSEILAILVQYLDYQTLKDCRLVCSKWNEGMFTRFQKRTKLDAKFTINIVNKSIPDFVSTFPPQEKDYDLSDESNSSTTFLFKNIKIYQPQYLHHPMLQNWIRSYGQNLYSIELGCTNEEAFEQWSYLENPNSYSYHEYLCSNIFHIDALILRKILMEWCYNLKELIIPRAGLFMEAEEPGKSNATESASSDEATIPLPTNMKPVVKLSRLNLSLEHHGVLEPLLKEVLSLVSSVNTLKLEGCADEQGMRELILSSEEASSSSTTARNDPTRSVSASLQTVVHFDVEQFGFKTPSTALATISSIKFRSLRLLKMKLSQLNSFSFEDTKYLMEVLGGEQFARLEWVTLGYINFPRGLTFPKLRYLKKMCLCADAWEESLDFLLQLPHLEIFGFNKKRDGTLPHLTQLFAPKSQLRKLKHWKLNHLELSCTPGEEYEAIVECFPNLEMLRIQPLADIERVLPPLTKGKKIKELAIIEMGGMAGFEKAVCDFLPEFKELERFYIGSPSPATTLTLDIFKEGILKAPFLRNYEFDFAYEAVSDYQERVRELLLNHGACRLHGEISEGNGIKIQNHFQLYTHRPKGFSWD